MQRAISLATSEWITDQTIYSKPLSYEKEGVQRVSEFMKEDARLTSSVIPHVLSLSLSSSPHNPRAFTYQPFILRDFV